MPSQRCSRREPSSSGSAWPWPEATPKDWTSEERSAYRSLHRWADKTDDATFFAMTAVELRRMEAFEHAKWERRQEWERVWERTKDERLRKIGEAASRASARPRKRGSILIDDVRDAAWLIKVTVFGPGDADVSVALREKISAAEVLVSRLAMNREAFLESIEAAPGDVFADGMATVRAFDQKFFALRSAWHEKWERLGAFEVPPLCHDHRMLGHIDEAADWYAAHLPSTTAEPAPSIPRELTRGVRRVQRAAPRLPTPTEKRVARRTAEETALLGAIRDNPAGAAATLERVLKKKHGTLAGILDRLLHRKEIENRGTRNRPQYYVILKE